MKIEIFFCDSALAMIEIIAQIPADTEILYQTPDENAETGEVTRCSVIPPRGETTRLEAFRDKFIIVAHKP